MGWLKRHGLKRARVGSRRLVSFLCWLAWLSEVKGVSSPVASGRPEEIASPLGFHTSRRFLQRGCQLARRSDARLDARLDAKLHARLDARLDAIVA